MKALIDQYLHYLTYQKRYSKHTITAYTNDLYSFADFLDLIYDLQDVTVVSHRTISSFIADLMESGLSPRSVNRKLSAIQSFFDFLLKESLLESNPAKNITRPKQSKKLPSILRSEQVRKLFNEIDFSNDFEGLRDKTMLMTLYACGLRREELIGLRLIDIDYNHNTLKVLGKRNKERLIPISKELVDVFKDYLISRSCQSSDLEELFITARGKKLYPTLVYQIVKKYLSMVTTMDKRSPHVLRHTFATHLLNEGANLQSIKELLGHSSLAATQVYTHTSLEKLKEVYMNSHPRNKK